MLRCDTPAVLQKGQQKAVEDVRLIVEGGIQLKICAVPKGIDVGRFALADLLPHRHCLLRQGVAGKAVAHHAAHQAHILRS